MSDITVKVSNTPTVRVAQSVDDSEIAGVSGTQTSLVSPVDGTRLQVEVKGTSVLPVAPQIGIPGTCATGNIVDVISEYDVQEEDDTIFADATGGALTINLLSAITRRGRKIRVKRINTNSNYVTITAPETLDGEAELILAVPYVSLDLESNGSVWFIV